MTISDPNETPPELRSKPELQAAIKIDVPLDGDGKVVVRLVLTRQLDDVEMYFASLVSGAMTFVDAETVLVSGSSSTLPGTLKAANEALAGIAEKAVNHRAAAERTKVEVRAKLQELGL